MTTTLERDLANLGAIDVDGPLSPWEPLAVEDRYGPPRATIDPDTSKGWIRRVAPLVRARRAHGSFFVALADFLGMTGITSFLEHASGNRRQGSTARRERSRESGKTGRAGPAGRGRAKSLRHRE